MRKLAWMIVGWTSIYCAPTLSQSEELALEPYVATYAVSYRGLDAGTLRMELKREQSNRYSFETRANPSVLARLVVGRDAIERTVFELGTNGIKPLEWSLEDGKRGDSGDGQLKFDWNAHKVVGRFEGAPVELPTQPGLQDRLSMQVAVCAALVQGSEPTSIVMVNGDRTREYNYERGDVETLDTNLGKLETVIYTSTRPGSNRVSKVWHAPVLEFLPIRVEQVRKGKVETVMQLVALERKQ